jgi:hypothetical protein
MASSLPGRNHALDVRGKPKHEGEESSQAAHLLLHQGIDIFPVLVQQPAIELLLPARTGTEAGKKLHKFTEQCIHLLPGNGETREIGMTILADFGHDK